MIAHRLDRRAALIVPGVTAPPASPFSIELDLAPEHAGRVFRHKAISGRRHGRTRISETAVTWHDAPAAFSRDDGALLALTDAGWTVQRTVRCCSWPVGTDTIATPGPPAEGDAPPRPLAALQGRTRRVELAADGADASSVALSLLEGTLRNVTTELACCRLRVEGAPRDAAALARALGETLPLVPARLSLAELARTLGQPDESEPPTPAIEAGGDVDAAMAALFGALSAALLLWLTRLGAFASPGTATAITPRAVHQARVATRRLRSALVLFAGPPGGSLAELAEPLKALAAGLGQARDWDVFLLETGAPIAAGLDGDRRIASLLADAEAAREAAHAELRRAMARPATRRLMLHLSLLAARRPWRDVAADPDGPDPLAQPVRALAPDLIERRFRKLVRVGKHLDGLDHVALHDTRKTAKKLRYALEFLSPVLPRGDTRKLLRRLATLQDQLGALNDISLGAALMDRIAPGRVDLGAPRRVDLGAPGRVDRSAPGRDRHAQGRHEFASGAVAGWLAARAAASQAELGATWRAVRHTERFWRV